MTRDEETKKIWAILNMPKLLKGEKLSDYIFDATPEGTIGLSTTCEFTAEEVFGLEAFLGHENIELGYGLDCEDNQVLCIWWRPNTSVEADERTAVAQLLGVTIHRKGTEAHGYLSFITEGPVDTSDLKAVVGYLGHSNITVTSNSSTSDVRWRRKSS